MIGALVFLGCPWRTLLRLAGGDLNALVGLAGLAVGIGLVLWFGGGAAVASIAAAGAFAVAGRRRGGEKTPEAVDSLVLHLAAWALIGVVLGHLAFGYDLCLRHVMEETRDGLDLSCWRVAYCGAEPVRWASARPARIDTCAANTMPMATASPWRSLR